MDSISCKEKGEFKPGSVGKVLPATEAFKIAEDGEILIRGKCLFLRYFKDDEGATEKMMEGGWGHTGDIGKLDDEGSLYIVDRKKDIIITSGGKNIAPSLIENEFKRSPYIDHVMVIGEGRKFLSALIQIDYENIGKWATEKAIPFTTYKSLAVNPEVYELVRREVEKVNGEFSRVENIRKFHILEKQLDHDDDELTATQKVRRSIIEEKFKDIIEKMYR